MTLRIGDCEVKVTAKSDYHIRNSDRDIDTKYFLNLIASHLMNAADGEEAKGYDAIAKNARELGYDIYNHLKSLGFYDD